MFGDEDIPINISRFGYCTNIQVLNNHRQAQACQKNPQLLASLNHLGLYQHSSYGHRQDLTRLTHKLMQEMLMILDDSAGFSRKKHA
ncbi:hypothetical protein [Photobacterium arenosum]|uniref:hypothetical protein n=1 Tax=Photobacterium arenosum TaxID=2774143 RepID=UPI00288ACBDE|nr:hypothetical protein [Photobacterium arenosum]